MDVSGMGKRYLDSLVSNVNDFNNNSQRNNITVTAANTAKIAQTGYFLDKNLQKRVQDVEKIQGLIDDLKNTKLMQDKDSLNPYVIQTTDNSANINFSIEDKEKVKEGDITIDVQKLAKATVISTDDLNTDRALNIQGNLQVNGFDIAIEASDSISTIREKIIKGDEAKAAETAKMIEDGTITEADPATENSNGISAFSREGVLYLKTNTEGEDTGISLEGSTTELLSSLGLVGENGDLKNLVQKGENGSVTINGDVMELKSNEISYDGVKLNFDNAIESEKSQVKISYDEQKVMDNLNEFKDKYNALVEYINKNVKDDASNADLQNIKYKLTEIVDSTTGIKANTGSFYDDLVDMKSGIGGIINENLKSAGVLSNKEGQIEFDNDLIKKNIDKIREMFNTDDENSSLSSFKKKLEPYTAKINTLEVTKAATQDVIDKIDQIGNKKSVIESAIKDNTDMLKFIDNQASTFGMSLDTIKSITPTFEPISTGLGASGGLGLGFGGGGFGSGNSLGGGFNTLF